MVHCPNIKGETEKLIFLYFTCALPEASLLNAAHFSTKDESGNLAKVPWRHMTDIFRLLLCSLVF